MADKKELQSILEKSGLSQKDAAQAVKSIQAMMGDRPKASSPEEVKKQVAQAEADLKLKKEKLELEENIMECCWRAVFKAAGFNSYRPRAVRDRKAEDGLTPVF